MRRAGVGPLAGVCLLLLFPASCARRGPKAAARPSVVALVGDRPVSYTDYAAYVKAASREEPKEVSPRVASSLLDQYVDELLLARAVEDATPAPQGETPAERRRDLIARRARLSDLGEPDLRKEYDAHAERYRHSALVRVSQLLLPSKEKADEAVKRLRAGRPWNEVSRELSAAPNAATGGTLGLLAQGDLPREFEKVVWALPEGGVSAAVATPHGYHVFRLEAKLESRTIPFEEAAPALHLQLAEERSAAASAELIAEARKAHPPAVVEEHLPFPYVGSLPRFGAGRR